MSNEKFDCRKILGISEVAGKRIMDEIITTLLQAKNTEEHLKLLTKNLNQMEKELFSKGFLLAMFTQNLGDINDMLGEKMKEMKK